MKLSSQVVQGHMDFINNARQQYGDQIKKKKKTSSGTNPFCSISSWNRNASFKLSRVTCQFFKAVYADLPGLIPFLIIFRKTNSASCILPCLQNLFITTLDVMISSNRPFSILFIQRKALSIWSSLTKPLIRVLNEMLSGVTPSAINLPKNSSAF